MDGIKELIRSHDHCVNIIAERIGELDGPKKGLRHPYP